MSRHPVAITGWMGSGLAVAVLAAGALQALAQPPKAATSPARERERVEYNRDVRPILSDNCFYCHGPDPKHREAKLRLDTREGAVADRGGSVAIVPGKPDESEMVDRIASDDPTEVMPPPKTHKTLTAAQKDVLRRWVAQGAEYQAHWAYIAPKRAPVPVVADAALVRNPVDAFVQKVLQDHGIKPAPEADRRTLIRRLSLDLTGLPPTPAEVSAFLADRSPGAYETLVDRLLASPHYGERMAQHWLDVARYADTVGYHGDQNQNAWAYRDYVVKAFNDDKPFDRFTVEQLAGDLLPSPTPEQRTASCFNRLNMMTREGGAQAKEYLAKNTADRVRTVGLAWLGTTMNCCECHDHKFDPVTMKDFYSIGAFFADVRQWGVVADYGFTPNPELAGWTNDHPWPPEIVVASPALEKRIETFRARIGQVVAAARLPLREFRGWEYGVQAFLKANPTGWETPKPAIKTGAAAKPQIEPDGRIAFTGTAATSDEFTLQPTPGWLAAVRVELLPDPAHKGRIVRSGDTAKVRPAFAVVGADGKPRPLAVRHALADRYEREYVNGSDVVGVQAGWTTEKADASQPHTAVYFLDRPVRLVKGETLVVKLPDSNLASVRVSTSPLAPADMQHPAFPANLEKSIAADARAFYLRSTAWNAAAYDQVKALEADLLDCRDGKTPVMVTQRTDKPLTIRVLKRGNWMDETGEICKPATPAALPKLPEAGSRPLTRLDLARWLCSPENSLTPRVVMNRLWRQLFGNGLSTQVDDLGAQGDPPSHPELLDWLAVEFRDGGWDVKRMVKLVVMSHTYRQSSNLRPELRESDPNNRLLSSQNPRRLEAEVVRDNALAIAGLLNPEVGGPPSHPYQPAGYYEGLQFPDRDYVAERDARQYRRGIYSHWQRTFLHPMLANFDAPSREDCLAIRSSANSPQQALTLLNDPEFVEAARVWAARLLKEPGKDAARLAQAYEQALARPPRAPEADSLAGFLAQARAAYKARPDDAAKLEHVGASPAPQGDPVELAAWTSICRVLLNLHETITRY
jgi:mono/diheme cytochrome c family protein